MSTHPPLLPRLVLPSPSCPREFTTEAHLKAALTLKSGSSTGTDIAYAASINPGKTVITIDPNTDLADGTCTWPSATNTSTLTATRHGPIAAVVPFEVPVVFQQTEHVLDRRPLRRRVLLAQIGNSLSLPGPKPHSSRDGCQIRFEAACRPTQVL